MVNSPLIRPDFLALRGGFSSVSMKVCSDTKPTASRFQIHHLFAIVGIQHVLHPSENHESNWIKIPPWDEFMAANDSTESTRIWK